MNNQQCDNELHTTISQHNTVVWEKFGLKKFFRKPGTTKIKHTKIFLPHIKRTVYNGSLAC